jgi:hypothetical protein
MNSFIIENQDHEYTDFDIYVNSLKFLHLENMTIFFDS